jgi:predicted amidohydrolase
MTSFTKFTLAAVQAAPIYFDRDASTQKACALISEAAQRGATIAAFGECWLPGYPFFVHGPNAFDPVVWRVAAEYIANAVEVPSRTTDRLCEVTKRAGIDVVIGIAERDSRTRGTVYCSLLFIGSKGEILGCHRKLKPTSRERTAWGEGDASSLRAYERPYGRVSGLNCWEHNMVLPGYVLMSEGTQIHVAAWPGADGPAPPPPVSLDTRQVVLSRAFASQAAAYVILTGGLLDPSELKSPLQDMASFPLTGDSYIIDPRGEILAGPASGEEILIAEGSTEHVFAAKACSDVAGHYSRPDLFQLVVNRRRPEHVRNRVSAPLADAESDHEGGPARAPRADNAK